jgi:hypothetical protein
VVRHVAARTQDVAPAATCCAAACTGCNVLHWLQRVAWAATCWSLGMQRSAGKAATQSSTFEAADAGRAVDGNAMPWWSSGSVSQAHLRARSHVAVRAGGVLYGHGAGKGRPWRDRSHQQGRQLLPPVTGPLSACACVCARVCACVCRRCRT